MDKQTLSEAISNAKKYAKNLKQQVSTNNPLHLSQNSISSDISNNQFSLIHTNSLAFNKAKSKIESIGFFQQKSPPRLADKTTLNNTEKLALAKKEKQSQSQRENNFQKSQNKLQTKHLTTLFGGTVGNREIVNKKNGHNYTYTHLNDLNSDKYSEVQSNISTKDAKISRLRHSKSPSKQVNTELNKTVYLEQNSRTSSVNYSKSGLRSKSEYKEKKTEVTSLVEEINRLQQIIKKYKLFILQIKAKYKEIQSKLAQKALNDHFVDVLKLQIQQLQDKNNQLNFVIAKQNQRINSFEFVLVDKITKINEYYSNYVKDRVQLQKQNETLKSMLLIAISTPKTTLLKNSDPGQLSIEVKNNSAVATISKSLESFNQKWS